MQEMQVRSLGQGDPPEKEMETLLQYSYLGNHIDRGDWQAIIQGVAKRWTNLATKQQQQCGIKIHQEKHY